MNETTTRSGDDGQLANGPGTRKPQRQIRKIQKKTGPYLKIVEQPASKRLRFRYGSEGHLGGLVAERSTNSERIFPTVELVGHKGRSVVVASCVTMDDPPRPHPFRLVGKDCCEFGCSNIKLAEGANRIVYSNLGIQVVKKKDIEASLKERASKKIDPFNTERDRNQIDPLDYDMNCVRLAFQAFVFDDCGGRSKVIPLEPILSNPIHDKRCSDLKICMICSAAGPVTGNSQLILLCEKVSRDDIKIRFYEGSTSSCEADNSAKWEAFAEFEPVHVHKQTAISFRTPAYYDVTITEPRTVFIQLYRPTDSMTSDSIEFQYIPAVDSDPMGLRRKRLRGDNDPRELVQNFEERAQNTTNPIEFLRKFKENTKKRPLKAALRRNKTDNAELSIPDTQDTPKLDEESSISTDEIGAAANTNLNVYHSPFDSNNQFVKTATATTRRQQEAEIYSLQVPSQFMNKSVQRPILGTSKATIHYRPHKESEPNQKPPDLAPMYYPEVEQQQYNTTTLQQQQQQRQYQPQLQQQTYQQQQQCQVKFQQAVYPSQFQQQFPLQQQQPLHPKQAYYPQQHYESQQLYETQSQQSYQQHYQTQSQQTHQLQQYYPLQPHTQEASSHPCQIQQQTPKQHQQQQPKELLLEKTHLVESLLELNAPQNGYVNKEADSSMTFTEEFLNLLQEELNHDSKNYLQI